MPVKIPKYSKDENLMACVRFAADMTGMNEFAVALCMSYFFEEVISQVGQYRSVTVPGFGTFGPYAYVRKYGGGMGVMPAFVGSRTFRRITHGLRASKVDNTWQHNKRRKNVDRGTGGLLSVSRSMGQVRMCLRKSAADYGYELPGADREDITVNPPGKRVITEEMLAKAAAMRDRGKAWREVGAALGASPRDIQDALKKSGMWKPWKRKKKQS